MQTLLFQACLPTLPNGVENRDKAYIITDYTDSKPLCKNMTKHDY